MADAKSTKLAVREEGGKFATVIKSDDYQHKFKEMLPTDVPVGRFTNVVLRAVQENSKLLEPATDKGSLFLACQRAAQDGLIPDGKEGALVMYGNKVQWQAMIFGLRKILAKHGFDLRTDLVYANDTFDYDLGDNPRITHKAAPLGQPRGDMIGAYAIARGPDGDLYREVMDKAQLDAVANVSRSGNSGPWSGPFRGEMYRKTVGRRLIKSLPIATADDLADVLRRDDENFDFNQPKEPSSKARQVQEAVAAANAPADEAVASDDVIDGDYTTVVDTESEPEAPAEDPPF